MRPRSVTLRVHDERIVRKVSDHGPVVLELDVRPPAEV